MVVSDSILNGPEMKDGSRILFLWLGGNSDLSKKNDWENPRRSGRCRVFIVKKQEYRSQLIA